MLYNSATPVAFLARELVELLAVMTDNAPRLHGGFVNCF